MCVELDNVDMYDHPRTSMSELFMLCVAPPQPVVTRTGMPLAVQSAVDSGTQHDRQQTVAPPTSRRINDLIITTHLTFT